jgi:glycosyltransferase involved in cell wall biosynthesis
MPKAHLYAAPAAAILGRPAVWFQHGLPSPRDPIDRLVTLLPAAAVLAPSRTVAREQERIRPRRRVHVAHPGVESAPAAGAPPVPAGVPAGAPVVGLVARLQRWKGVHVLVEALPRVLGEHPDAHVVVVGGDHPLEPGYRDELVALAARLGVADRVHLVGYQADARAWMGSFDVVVHASDREPFGIVVLEAMAAGKPIVAGAAGGPAEIVRDGVDGLLVAYGDAEGLAERIGRLLDDPALAERLGRAGAERARDFSTVRFADEVIAALRSPTTSI